MRYEAVPGISQQKDRAVKFMRRDRISPPQGSIVASVGVKGSGQSRLVKKLGSLIRVDFDEIAAVINMLKSIGNREFLECPRKEHGATSIVAVEQDTWRPCRHDFSLQPPLLLLPEPRIVSSG